MTDIKLGMGKPITNNQVKYELRHSYTNVPTGRKPRARQTMIDWFSPDWSRVKRVFSDSLENLTFNQCKLSSNG